jgi:lipopolysaccharide/colanic/teichoic acid biosynthesis glycosyltransferase
MERNFTYIYDGMNAFEKEVKRMLDFLLAAVCLIVFSPLFLACYIAVKRNHDGPVIFKQERIGRFGRPFYIYKFRSMRIDAENDGPHLCSDNRDKRLTKTGRFLRAHHLDELPQLWNIFTGDMAFIGPRPERKYYINQIIERDARYTQLYKIRPGVTSYATLYNGYTDTIEKMLRRLELDLYYLEHHCWWFDCKILLKTFTNIISGKKF